MVLESTMICLDNSDWMRNGDYIPSRLESQKDAAGLLCNDRINSNPENTVGILTMAGQGVELLVSPTEDSGKILSSFTRITISGKSDLVTSVQIAQLALKHRKNKNGGQRIIAFVGGPIFDPVEKLQKIGKQLKKNNVAISIISIGEIEDNASKLSEFVNATNTNDNSHLITVPPGLIPADAIACSPIMHIGSMAGGMHGDQSGFTGGGDAGGGDIDWNMYGIDPAQDPELAMAIRVSIEEGRAHEEARVKALQEQTSNGGVTLMEANGEAKIAESGTIGSGEVENEDDEDAIMQRALEMSMNNINVTDQAMDVQNGEEEEEMDEDLKRALEMSTAPTTSSSSIQFPTSGGDALSADTAFLDPDFVNQLLNGADPNDPLIQAALAQLNANSSNDQKSDENSKKRKGDE